MIIPHELVLSKIFSIRGQKVMLDSDLADLYQVETKRLKEQVRRNITRFPASYMFELTEEESAFLRSQFATSKKGRGGARYLPMVFTEHGVLQLSNVLTSERAEKVSFTIIDVFVKLRTMLLDNAELRLAFEEMKKDTANNTKNIELVFQYLQDLIEKKESLESRKQIGYVIPK